MAGHFGEAHRPTTERIDVRQRSRPQPSNAMPRLRIGPKEDPDHRSWTMAQVKSKNTTPEMVVRRAAHAMGLRYRLHREDLPGRPDLVFPRWRVAVFVNGCFWHCHEGCSRARVPRSNRVYWIRKLAGNVRRDRENMRSLRKAGWRVVVIWECESKDSRKLAGVLRRKIVAKALKARK